MLNIYEIGLQHFAEGGADGAGQGDGGNGLSGDFSADMQKYFGVKPSSDAGSNYGETTAEETASAAETEAETAAASGQQSGEDPDAEFEALIKGKYKDQFGKRTQGIINERFRKSKETESALTEEINKYKRITSVLRDKYGLDEGTTPEQIEEAVQADNTMFSRQAMAAGLPTDAYRDQFMQAQRQKAEEAAQQQAQAQQQAEAEQQQKAAAMQQTYDRWQQEAEELKKQFPQFDLAAEVKGNEAFRKALVAGIPVAQAYYGANFDKISSGLVAAASQDAARRTAQTVAANRARPVEGGQSAGTGIRTDKRDVNSLSGKEIRDIINQVEHGARISF